MSEDEISDRPVFTKWAHLNRRPVPLLIYITVNLPIFGDEGDESNKKESNPDDSDEKERNPDDKNKKKRKPPLRPLRKVEAIVETHGGFRSATRSDADVLVLNLETNAGERYMEQARPDQVIWTREELEEHAASGVPLDLGKDIQPREIVVARTNAASSTPGTTVRRRVQSHCA